ncbi:MAG: DUF4832 domain-containing protein [Mariniphaga sp.]
MRKFLSCSLTCLTISIITGSITGQTDEKTKLQITVWGDSVNIKPIEYLQTFRNPMIGLREFYFWGKDKIRSDFPYPYGSVIKEYMPWNKMENMASDGVQKIIDYSNIRWNGYEDLNIKVIPRPFIVWVEKWHNGKDNNPNNPRDIEGSHWPSDISPQQSPLYWNGERAVVAPKDSLTPIIGGYFDPNFPARVKELVRKLALAWDKDPRVAYIEMGIIGEYGEHHDPDISTYWPSHEEISHLANRTWVPGIEKVLGDAFTEYFKNKKVLTRYAYEFRDYNFGILWDVWGVPIEQVRGYDSMKTLGDRWKTQVISGEFGFIGSFKRYKGVDELIADKKQLAHLVETLRNLHCSSLGGITWSDFSKHENLKNYNVLQDNMGYRYVLTDFNYPTKIEIKKSFNISFKVKNTGAAPMYYNWPVEIALLDSDTRQIVWKKKLEDVDIRDWQPGDNWDMATQKYTLEAEIYTVNKELTLDADLPKGKYIISIAILDPAGDLPSLRFAVGNYFTGGRHPMGYLGVGIEISDYELNPVNFNDIQDDRTLKYIGKSNSH